MTNRDSIVERIIGERARQGNLAGTEFDFSNTPNEWTTIAAHYLFEEIRRGPNKPTREAFENSLVKAAAVILAALEHSEVLDNAKHFAPKDAS